jgi:hypothetical protein
MKSDSSTYIAVLAGVAFLFLIYNYRTKKSTSNMTNVAPSSQSSAYETVQDQSVQSTAPASDLLPKDVNKQWSSMNPSGNGQLQGVNLMKAGSLIGINTVGSSLRNANLQVRSEPPNPQMNTGPWNQSTIEPDKFRTPLELHCGPQ